MSEIVEKLQQSSVRSLSRMLRGVVDENSNILVINQNGDALVMTFMDNMNREFDRLLDKYKEETKVVDYESLSLVDNEELSAMVAVEGMVANARNLHLPSFISFNTRLNALFQNKRIDESTNPLDPLQIASSFSDALRTLDVTQEESIRMYRSFNNVVLKHIDEVLREANRTLIEHGVIPNLGMDSAKGKSAPARSTPRQPPSGSEFNTFGTVEEDPYERVEEQPELFTMMQNLLHREDSSEAAPAPVAPVIKAPPETPDQNDYQQYAVPASMLPTGEAAGGVMQPFKPAPGEQVQMVDQVKLMEILTNIQQALENRERNPAAAAGVVDDQGKVDISQSLGDMLKDSQTEGIVSAVDRQSADIINLVTLLYDAIWQDESVPNPIKELIGRTQITIIKVALSDTTFFNREDHPARKLLNEYAAAGIGWTEVENLSEDPLYVEIEKSVTAIQTSYDGGIHFFENLISGFKEFRANEAAKTRTLEQRILKAKERQERIEDINELVTQKITERILGRDLHPFVVQLLEEPFHKFMVMLVLKEGPGSNAWKQSINTIDVLLWSVQPHEQEGDRKRLDTVNPRLLNNLRKALRIAQKEPAEVDSLITRLKDVQEQTFGYDKTIADNTEANQRANETPSATPVPAKVGAKDPSAAERDEEITEDDPALAQVDALNVGIWVEFAADDMQSIRCKLAAKINAIDKFIFVNRQGVKVVEKTRMGLARELRDNTVRIISDGLLFSRALESVIGNLRETQHEQHTGSAYQPD